MLNLIEFVVLFYQKVAYLRSHVDAAAIPAAKKADLRAKILLLQVFHLMFLLEHVNRFFLEIR